MCDLKCAGEALGGVGVKRKMIAVNVRVRAIKAMDIQDEGEERDEETRKKGWARKGRKGP